MTISSSQHLLIRHFLSKSLSGVWERLEKGRMAHNVSNVLLIFLTSCILIHTPVFSFSNILTTARINFFSYSYKVSLSGLMAQSLSSLEFKCSIK